MQAEAAEQGYGDDRIFVTGHSLGGWEAEFVAQQTGLALGYVEQLYTFGDRFRDPRERAGGPRVIAMTYLGKLAFLYFVENQELRNSTRPTADKGGI